MRVHSVTSVNEQKNQKLRSSQPYILDSLLGSCVHVQVLQGGLCVKEARGCPIPDTVGSRQLQQTHPRAQLSLSAMGEAPLGKHS